MRRVDLATMPLTAQLSLLRRTRVLVSVHGGGLAHMLEMPAGSAVLELNRGGNFHYANLAQVRQLL
jgi:capsular polysaccharide biosynthesis protein